MNLSQLAHSASQMTTAKLLEDEFRSSLRPRLNQADYFAPVTFTKCRIALLAPM